MLPNKVILVTGGSRGIGANIVQELSKQGYTVIMNYNKSEEQANKIKNELGNNGIHIDIVKADISKRIELVENSGAIEYCNYIIEEEREKSVTLLETRFKNHKLLSDFLSYTWLEG